METVSKFPLNPLATCFVPSSMIYQGVTCSVFSLSSYETLNEPVTTKNWNSQAVLNEQNAVSEYLPVIEVESDFVKEEALGDLCVTVEVKETLSDTAEEAVTENEPLTTERAISTVNEMSECALVEAESNDERCLVKNSKEIINLKDTCLTKLDISLPNQTLVSKITKLLKGGTKTIWTLLPSAVRSLLIIQFFYRMGLKTISLKLTMTSPLCPVLKPRLKTITYPGNAKKSKTKNRKIKGGECHCPPMFGWIIPHRFFGNPFKLCETCCNDSVHTSYANESSRHPQYMQSKSYESCDSNHEKTTLEQCSSELKAVIKDVCDFLSLDDPSTEDPDHISENRKRPVWENETEKKIGDKCSVPDIIDDGVHPLLQDPPEKNEDIEMSSVQTILEKAFSDRKTSSGETLPNQSVCNPPCSIWCNEVPSPAKDAYKRFIRKMDLESAVRHKVTNANKQAFKKPLYKRSFSADDTPKSDEIPLLPPFSFEIKERSLLQKSPLLLKPSSISALKDFSRKSRSNSPVVVEQCDLNEKGPNKWSMYDGVDSMWQPLPECHSLSDPARKQSHKRARDVRRQKSVC